MPRSAPLALAAALAAGAFAAPAQAALPTTTLASGNDVATATVSGNAIDIDSAPDGSTVGVWQQREGAIDHIFAARLIGGTWTAAQRVDTGLATPSGPPQVAVGHGGEATIVFPNGPAPATAKLYAVTAPSSAAPFGAPITVQGDPAGWARVDVDVAASGDGFLIAHESKHLWAFRVVDGAFSPVGAAFPTPAGILNVNPAEEAGIDTQRAGHVSVATSGGAATVAWTEGSGGNYKLFARRISAAAPQIGPAVDGAVPTIDGRPLATTGQDEISLATGGDTTWVAFRSNYTYPNGGGTVDRARLLARTFDGASFGPAQVVDSVPSTVSTVTEGAEFPQLFVDQTGKKGIAISHTQATNRAAIGNMSDGFWNPAVELFTQYDMTATMTASGVGAGFTLDQLTGRQITAHIIAGTANGSQVAVNDPAAGPVFTTGRAAPVGDGAALLWRQGQASDAKILTATIVLPPLPAPLPTGTPSPSAGGSIAPKLSRLRLIGGPVIRRASRKPVVLTGKTSGSAVEFTLDRPARVTVLAFRARDGKLDASGRCTKPSRVKRSAKRCTRLVVVPKTALTLSRPAGTTRLRFTGRLAGTRLLDRGRYVLEVVAANAAGDATSTQRTAIFRLR